MKPSEKRHSVLHTILLNDSLNSTESSQSAVSTCDPLEDASLLRQQHHSRDLLLHFNINSLQNKIEELRVINHEMKASIIILTETKIDSSYPNSQFRLGNYRLFRQDRKEGGGGIMAYVKCGIEVRRLTIPQTCKSLEALALDVKLGDSNIIILGIYRPPRSGGTSHYITVEDELCSIHSWALLQRQSIITMGDLNLDRLKPHSTEGKILIDLEDTFQLECLINDATRETSKSRTLLDVVLTNKPELFGKAGVIDFGLSDHKWSPSMRF